MADSSSHDPTMASSGTGGVEERPEVVPQVVETTVGGAATAEEAVGGTHGPGEAMARIEETQGASTVAGDAGEGETDPVSIQNLTGTSDPDRVSPVGTIPSTSGGFHTVIDIPVHSTALSTVFDIVDTGLVAVGGSGGVGDAAGGDVGGTGRGGGVVGGADRGVGHIGERILSLGGLDVLVGDDVVMEDLGTGERDGGDLRGGDSLVSGTGGGGDGSTPVVPTGDSSAKERPPV